MMFVRKEAFRIEVSCAGWKMHGQMGTYRKRREKMSEPMKNPPDRKDTDGETELSERNGKSAGCSSPGRQSSDFISPQLLCAVQQLRTGISVAVFFDYGVLLQSEYFHRRRNMRRALEEVQRLIRELPAVHPIRFVEGKYDPECYYEAVRGHEKDPEGGERCGICFEMRLREAAKLAAEGGYDWFTTTLTISPLKMPGASIRSGRRWEKSIMWHFCRRISRKRGDISARLSCRRSIIYIGRITADACSRSGSVKSRCRRRGRKHRDLRGDMFGRR